MMRTEENGSWKMGERERLRRAKKKNQRIIAAVIGLLAVAIVVLTICLTHKLSRNSGTQDLAPENSITLETQSVDETDEPDVTDDPDDLDEPEPPEVSETPNVSESPEVSTSPDSSTSSTTTAVAVAPNVSGASTTTSTGGTATTQKTNSTTSSSGSTTNRKSTTTTTSVARIKSATLYCSVSSATEGGTATLSYKAVDSNGKDITSQCVVTFTQTDNCTVSNKTVTFTKAGTAQITAKVTYKMTAVKTQTLSIPVSASTAKLSAVALNCSVSAAQLNQTGTLTVTALDANGVDISSKCTVTYTVDKCAFQDNTVTFNTVGTAAVYATVTYDGVTLQTNTVGVTVTEPTPEVAGVYLYCTAPETVDVGEGTGDYWIEVRDSNGKDITKECQIETKVTGCVIQPSEGNALQGNVSFPEVGTADFYVVATYNGKSMESNHFKAIVQEKIILTSAQVVLDVEKVVELGTEKTLSFVAKDQLGREISGCTVTYSGNNCTISKDGSTVTFDQVGTAEIAATVEYNGTTVVSDPPVSVSVQVGYTLDDGTVINLADVSQTYTDEKYGYELNVPSYFTAVEEKDENGEVVTTLGRKAFAYDKLNMTVTAVGSSRNDQTATLKAQYEARLAELGQIEDVTVSSKRLDSDKSRYTICWEQDGTITQETVCLSGQAETQLVLTYPTSQKEACSQIATYTTNAFELVVQETAAADA